MPHTLQHTFAFQSRRSLELFGEQFGRGCWKKFEGSYVALKSRTNAKAVEKAIEKILENSYVC